MDETKNRPNILHFFVDQMRFDGIGALSNSGIQTPNLDRLVRRGTAFTNAYSPCPVCVPARCSMIYGQYPHNTGCYENESMPTDGRATFMDILSETGYNTHAVGKCHFTPDPLALRGFRSRETQEELPDNVSNDDYLTHLHKNGFPYIIDPHGVRGEMYYVPQVSQLPQEFHPTQWIGDRSVEFIKNSDNTKEPWYLFSSFVHPHPPFSPPTPWHKLYGPDEVPLPLLPPSREHLLTYVNQVQNRYKYRDQGFDLNLVRVIRAYYFSCISFIDFQVGRILSALEHTTGGDNTLVIFSSDHGEYLGDYGCFGKRGIHDAAVRIPLVISQLETFDTGRMNDTPVSLVDIAPTICRTAGVAGEHDGLPLQDLVTGNVSRNHVFAQLAYSDSVNPTRGGSTAADTESSSERERAASSWYLAVSRTYKYAYSAPDQSEYLIDRTIDPNETWNRAYSPKYRRTTDNMRETLIDHLSQGGEVGGIDNHRWKAFEKRNVSPIPDAGLLIQNQPWAQINLPADYSPHRKG